MHTTQYQKQVELLLGYPLGETWELEAVKRYRAKKLAPADAARCLRLAEESRKEYNVPR